MTDSLREQSAATAQDTLWSETAEKAEQLRLLYHLDRPTLDPEHLVAWLASGSRSKLRPFVKLARTIRRHRPVERAARRA